MEFKVSCQYQKGFNWHQANGVRFIGYIYNSDNELITGTDAINLFSSINSTEEIINIIKKCNGIFSLILFLNNKLYAFCDKSRFFSLFYFRNAEQFYISDDFYYLIKLNSKASFNKTAVNQFLSGTITIGSHTVIDNIMQVQASELVEVNGENLFHHIIPTIAASNTSYNYSKEESVAQFKLASERLCKGLQNKQVILPLSGGYDSRLIACWLKQNNIKDVVCFTYGRKGTPDIHISKQVAQTLGYEWYYIEHTPLLVADFQNDPEFTEYYKYMSRGTSMFYMQEYFAVRELYRRGVVQPGFVAIPGHSGDMLGGSQFYKVIPPDNKIDKLIEKVYRSSFPYMHLNQGDKKVISNQLEQQLHTLKESLNLTADYNIFEEWLVRERIAKYVFNSAHVFTLFGGEVRFPFWDNELYAYWFKMPIEKRLYKSYFDDLLNEFWFEPMNLAFQTELQASNLDLSIQKIKKLLRPYLPAACKQKLLKKNDWTLYDDITAQFLPELKELGIKVKHNNKSYINRILHWYLAQLQKEFSLEPFN